MTMTTTRNYSRTIHKAIRCLPVVGSLYRVANAYAFEGKAGSHSSTAPIKQWWHRVFKLATSIAIFVVLITSLIDEPINKWAFNPSSTILSIFPSILGFGIGVYALLFVMPKDFFQDLANKENERKFGPEIVPVDMGYPLVIFITVMFIAVISEVFPTSTILKYISLFSLFYGLAMVVELITFLFNSSIMIQRIRKN